MIKLSSKTLFLKFFKKKKLFFKKKYVVCFLIKPEKKANCLNVLIELLKKRLLLKIVTLLQKEKIKSSKYTNEFEKKIPSLK